MTTSPKQHKGHPRRLPSIAAAAEAAPTQFGKPSFLKDAGHLSFACPNPLRDKDEK